MPACFTLTRKGESIPSSLQHIDNEMRVEFGEEPDEERWLWEWYNVVGFGLAMGQTWEQLREQFAEDPGMLAVIDWLDEHYTKDAWAEVGRR